MRVRSRWQLLRGGLQAFAMGPRRRTQFVLLFVIGAVQSAVSSNLRRKVAVAEAKLLFPVGPDASQLQVPQCTCGCCHVTYRTPDEMGQGGTVFLKCAVDEVQSQGSAVAVSKDLNGKVRTSALSCQSSCHAPEDKSDQPNTTKTAAAAGVKEESTMDYNRYCFYNCRPYDFTVGNICVSLSDKFKKALEGEVDPAVHPQVTDPKLQKAWAEMTGASPMPTEPPRTTTPKLPCEQSDPCAYGMMRDSITEAKAAYEGAQRVAASTDRIASLTGKKASL